MVEFLDQWMLEKIKKISRDIYINEIGKQLDKVKRQIIMIIAVVIMTLFLTNYITLIILIKSVFGSKPIIIITICIIIAIMLIVYNKRITKRMTREKGKTDNREKIDTTDEVIYEVIFDYKEE